MAYNGAENLRPKKPKTVEFIKKSKHKDQYESLVIRFLWASVLIAALSFASGIAVGLML